MKEIPLSACGGQRDMDNEFGFYWTNKGGIL